ncbi:MAG: hypothetical protein AAFY41_06285, partial [Bacteroidota bacterium]
LEIDGDTFHQELPAVAHQRTSILEQEGVHIERVRAVECDTEAKAQQYIQKLQSTIKKVKSSRR